MDDLYRRAGHLIDMERPKDALPLLQQALTDAPDDARSWGLMALALAADGAPNGSEYARKAIALSPDEGRWHEALGLALMAQEAPWLAIEPMRRAVALNPEDAMARNNLGLALFQDNKPVEAVQHFEAAIKLDPGLQAAVHNLALAAAELKNHADSLTAVESALRMQPDDPQTHTAKGLILLRQGDLPGAEDSFRTAIRYDPSSMHAKLALASITRRKHLVWGPWCRLALWMSRMRIWQRVVLFIIFIVFMQALLETAMSGFLPWRWVLGLLGFYTGFLLYLLLAGPMLRLSIQRGWLDVR